MISSCLIEVKRNHEKFIHFAPLKYFYVNWAVTFSLFNFLKPWSQDIRMPSAAVVQIKKSWWECHTFPSMLCHPSWLNCSSSCRLIPIPLPSSSASWAQISFPCLSKSTHMPDWVLLCLTFLFWAGSGVQELPGKHASMIQPCRSAPLLFVLAGRKARGEFKAAPLCWNDT